MIQFVFISLTADIYILYIGFNLVQKIELICRNWTGSNYFKMADYVPRDSISSDLVQKDRSYFRNLTGSN